MDACLTVDESDMYFSKHDYLLPDFTTERTLYEMVDEIREIKWSIAADSKLRS